MLLLAAQLWLAATVVTGALLATAVLVQGATTVARQLRAAGGSHGRGRVSAVASSHG